MSNGSSSDVYMHKAEEILRKPEELLEEMQLENQQEKKYFEISIKADFLKLLAIVAREYDKHDDLELLD